MVEFDIAVIRGSQSPQIFDEYAALHPGLARLRASWLKVGCKCGLPDCFQHNLQHLLEDVPLDKCTAFADAFRGEGEVTEGDIAEAMLKLEDPAPKPVEYRSSPYVQFIEFGREPE